MLNTDTSGSRTSSSTHQLPRHYTKNLNTEQVFKCGASSEFESSSIPSRRNFNWACPAIQRCQGSGFLAEGSSWLTACMSEQQRFWQDCADVQARLNLRCSHRRVSTKFAWCGSNFYCIKLSCFSDEAICVMSYENQPLEFCSKTRLKLALIVLQQDKTQTGLKSFAARQDSNRP